MAIQVLVPLPRIPNATAFGILTFSLYPIHASLPYFLRIAVGKMECFKCNCPRHFHYTPGSFGCRVFLCPFCPKKAFLLLPIGDFLDCLTLPFILCIIFVKSNNLLGVSKSSIDCILSLSLSESSCTKRDVDSGEFAFYNNLRSF